MNDSARSYRRQFAALWLGTTLVSAAPADFVKETVIYKKVDGIELKADVFHDGTTKPKPAVVWIRGGGVINGHREQLSGQVRDFAFTNGYVLFPFEQSQLMAREFEKHGVPFEFHQITNGEHGLAGGDPGQIKEANRKAFEFVKRHLEQP